MVFIRMDARGHNSGIFYSMHLSVPKQAGVVASIYMEAGSLIWLLNQFTGYGPIGGRV